MNIPKPNNFADIDCFPYFMSDMNTNSEVHELDIFDKDAKEAIFIDQQTHEMVHIPLYSHEPSLVETVYHFPHGTGYNFVYRLRGLGIYGTVISSTPLKFDKLI